MPSRRRGRQFTQFGRPIPPGGGDLTGYLLGGWFKDGWDQETYRFYSLTGELGAAPGTPPAPFGEEGNPCHDTLAPSFTTSPVSAGGLVRHYAAGLATAVKNGLGTSPPEFNPDKFPLFVAELSRGRHDSTDAVFGLQSNAISPSITTRF